MSDLAGRLVFVDTAAWYAIGDASDQYHLMASRIRDRLLMNGIRLVTTNFVIAETHALALRRQGRDQAYVGLRALLRGSVWRVPVEPADEARAVEIIERYADKAFSYTDATSFAVMGRLGVETAFTFDRHFAQFGVTVLEAGGA